MTPSLADARRRAYRFRDIRRSLKSRRKMRVLLMQITASRSTAHPLDATQAQPATPQGQGPGWAYTPAPVPPASPSRTSTGRYGGRAWLLRGAPHRLSMKVPAEARSPHQLRPGVPLRAARAAHVSRCGGPAPGPPLARSSRARATFVASLNHAPLRWERRRSSPRPVAHRGTPQSGGADPSGWSSRSSSRRERSRSEAHSKTIHDGHAR